MISPVGRSRVETAGAVVPAEEFWTLGLELPIILCIRGVKEKKVMSLLKVGGPGAEFSFLPMCRSSWNCFYVSPT